MIYRIIYNPIALEEYKDAVMWYKERSIIASENFVIAVKEKIKLITDNPFQFKNQYKNFRETSLKKFPYCIVYFINSNAAVVVVTSIFHHKRNPKLKYRKN